ncbi:MAG: MFS transporter [Brevinema sp.]
MRNPLQFAGYDRSTARSFLIVGVASQVIYSIDSIRDVLYDQYLAYLGVSNVELGILYSIASITYLLFIIFGWIHSFFQAKYFFSIGLLINAIMGFIIFLRPQMGFQALLPIYIIYVIRELMFWPATLNYIRSFSSPKNQGLTFSLHEFLRRMTAIAINILAIICIFLSAGQLWGIRLAILLNSILILGFYFLTIKKVPKIDLPQRTGGGFQSYIFLLRMPEIWLVGLCGMAVTANFYVLLLAVPFLRGGFHLDAASAGIIALSANSILGAAACLFSGVLADKLFKSPSRMIKYMLYALLVVVSFLLFLPKSPEYIASCIIAICLMATVVYSLRGLTYAPLAEVGIEQKHNGAAASIVSFISLSPGLWMHIFNGQMLDIFKDDVLRAYGIMFSLCLGINVTAIIGAHRLDWRLKRKRSQDPIPVVK